MIKSANKWMYEFAIKALNSKGLSYSERLEFVRTEKEQAVASLLSDKPEFTYFSGEDAGVHGVSDYSNFSFENIETGSESIGVYEEPEMFGISKEEIGSERGIWERPEKWVDINVPAQGFWWAKWVKPSESEVDTGKS